MRLRVVARWVPWGARQNPIPHLSNVTEFEHGVSESAGPDLIAREAS